MLRAGGEERVDAPAPGGLDRFGAALDVGDAGAREAADGALGDDLGDLAHRLEVAVGGDREASLDHVDAHFLEDLGEFELLVERHRSAGRLLAVAHGGVEDNDAVLVVVGYRFRYWGGHGRVSSLGFLRIGRRDGPLSARLAKKRAPRSAPRGG